MRVLVNFSPLKNGGGQNVGLNFLYSLHKQDLANMEFSFLVAKDSEIHKVAKEHKLNILSVMPRNPFLRILKEMFVVSPMLRRFKIDVVYSYFGVGAFPKGIPQITGSADSNLYFPEVDFWSHYKGLRRLLKWGVDRYRVWGVKRSAAVVFENSAMESNAKKIFGLSHTCFIKPSVNFLVPEETYELPFKAEDGRKVGLFLCGWQLNKNIMLIPKLARKFKDRGVDFKFLITAPDDDSRICSEFKASVKAEDVGDIVYIVGVVKKSQLPSLYKQVDFVFLLSLLESFSNNIIEAWFFERPLVISREEWALSICGDAACYVDRDNVDDIVDSVTHYFNVGNVENLLSRGKNLLSTYPDIDSRTRQELLYVKSVAEESY